MARQVAHEIKNPLTPDPALGRAPAARARGPRGALGPVLEGCVDAILGSGPAAAADLSGVLELRFVADRENRARGCARARR